MKRIALLSILSMSVHLGGVPPTGIIGGQNRDGSEQPYAALVAPDGTLTNLSNRL